MHKKFEFEYEELDSKEALVAEDLALLDAAFKAVKLLLRRIQNSKWVLLLDYQMDKSYLGPIKRVQVIL